jgi:hypothetical protein
MNILPPELMLLVLLLFRFKFVFCANFEPFSGANHRDTGEAIGENLDSLTASSGAEKGDTEEIQLIFGPFDGMQMGESTTSYFDNSLISESAGPMGEEEEEEEDNTSEPPRSFFSIRGSYATETSLGRPRINSIDSSVTRSKLYSICEEDEDVDVFMGLRAKARIGADIDENEEDEEESNEESEKESGSVCSRPSIFDATVISESGSEFSDPETSKDCFDGVPVDRVCIEWVMRTAIPFMASGKQFEFETISSVIALILFFFKFRFFA